VGAGIKLDTVLASDGAQVFTFCGVNSDFFVDKLDLGHDSGPSAILDEDWLSFTSLSC
jgi:hypothetical protein